MSETPKRRWFQIHLSTAIAGMFLAGLLLFLNLGVNETERPWSEYPHEFKKAPPGFTHTRPDRFISKVQGWPVVFYHYGSRHWDQAGLITDVLVCGGILCVFVSVAEYLNRRRSRRPQQAQGETTE